MRGEPWSRMMMAAERRAGMGLANGLDVEGEKDYGIRGEVCLSRWANGGLFKRREISK